MILLKKTPIVFPPKKFRAIPILTHFLLISGNFGSVDFPLPSCLKFPFCVVFKPNSPSSLGCNRGCATKGVKNKRAYHGPLGNAPNWGLGRKTASVVQGAPRSCRRAHARVHHGERSRRPGAQQRRVSRPRAGGKLDRLEPRGCHDRACARAQRTPIGVAFLVSVCTFGVAAGVAAARLGFARCFALCFVCVFVLLSSQDLV